MNDKKTTYFVIFQEKMIYFVFMSSYFMIIFIFEPPKKNQKLLPWNPKVPGFAAPWHPGASHGRMQVAGFEGKPQVGPRPCHLAPYAVVKKKTHCYKVGPLLVINGVMGPL